MLTGPEINTLGQIVDTTWGHSSRVENQPASRGLKWQWLAEGKLIGICSYIINLSSFRHMAEERKKAREEAESIIDGALKEIKSKFKEEAGRTLKTNQLQLEDSVEPFKSVPGPALFRLKVILGVE